MDENSVEQRLIHCGLILPPAPTPMGVYKPSLIEGRYLYISGHGAVKEDGSLIIGRVGQDMDIEKGKIVARQAGLASLATIKSQLGSLDGVRRVIKILGMVGCVPEFDKHPYVINGCSELFAAIWGDDNGVGVRSAIGVGALPNNIPEEIEALFQLY